MHTDGLLLCAPKIYYVQNDLKLKLKRGELCKTRIWAVAVVAMEKESI